jgi:hypothetical protein
MPQVGWIGVAFVVVAVVALIAISVQQGLKKSDGEDVEVHEFDSGWNGDATGDGGEGTDPSSN